MSLVFDNFLLVVVDYLHVGACMGTWVHFQIPGRLVLGLARAQ